MMFPLIIMYSHRYYPLPLNTAANFYSLITMKDR